MPGLRELEDRSYRAIQAKIAQYEREVNAILKDALDDIRSELTRTYEKYAAGGDLTLAEMTQYNRLQTLEKNVVDTMSDATRKTVGKINHLSPDVYEESFFRHAWAVDEATGVAVTWGQLPEQAIRESLDNRLYKLAIKTYTQDAPIRILRELNSGLALGKSYQEMAAGMKDAINATGYQAMRIIRTEGQTAQTAAQDAAYTRAQEQGIDLDIFWDAALDGRTRDSHASMDGAQRDETGMFTLPNSERTPYPAWQNLSAGERINCLPDTVTVTARKIRKKYKRFYSGDIVTIKTASGAELTATPNHPVFTKNGWVLIGLIKQGDDIVCVDRGQLGRLSKPYKYSKPAMIGQVFQLGNIIGRAERVPGLDMDFHGDGMNTDINIKAVHGLLTGKLYPALSKHSAKFLLTCTGIFTRFLHCMSVFQERCFSPFSPTYSRMSGLGQPESFISRSSRHSSEHGLASIPSGEPDSRQSPINAITGNTNPPGNRQDGLAGIMRIDNVIKVDRNNYSGHVYNLETQDGYYIAHNADNGNMGFIVHNCRCRLRGNIDGYAPAIRRTRDQGLIPYQKYDDWKKGLNARNRNTAKANSI